MLVCVSIIINICDDLISKHVNFAMELEIERRRRRREKERWYGERERRREKKKATYMLHVLP